MNGVSETYTQSKKYGNLETYNAKVIEYEGETHVTHYLKAITRGHTKVKKSNFRKDYINVDRTDKEIEHCLNQALRRTKNTIYYIARSNEWDYFITLTFNREIVDSSDYDLVVKKLMTFLNNLKSRKCHELKYLIVPEFHADNLHYHLHGLLSNTGDMVFRDSGLITDDGKTIYNIVDWSYGFTTATKIDDTKRVSSYVTKYITKQTCSILKNKKRYYASRNCNRVEEQLVVMDRDAFVMDNADRIKYINVVDVPVAHQSCMYIEVSNDGKVYNDSGTLQNGGTD